MSTRGAASRGRLPMAPEQKAARGRRAHRSTKDKPKPPPALPPLGNGPPEWLGELAKQRWHELVETLRTAGVLKETDATALASHCEAFEAWRRALDLFNACKEEPGKGFIQARGEGFALHPAAKALESARTQLLTTIGHLGLSPATRARIDTGPPPAPPANRFANNGTRDQRH